jgi:hypothetical protein
MSQTQPIGVITCILARHAEEALGLGRSIRLNSPGLPSVCIVEGELSDALRSTLETCYSEVVILRPEHARLGWQVKNVLMDYSPFEHTLFLDSDCLVMRDLRPVFTAAGERDVGFATKADPVQETGGFLFAKINLAKMMKHFQVDWWPQILLFSQDAGSPKDLSSGAGVVGAGGAFPVWLDRFLARSAG